MALVRCTCSECGDIELRTRDITVRMCVDLDESVYNFRCPVCRMVEVKSADDQVVDILTAAGVKFISWSLPAEMWERPGGERINHDDAIDLHELLEQSDDVWYAQLLEMTT